MCRQKEREFEKKWNVQAQREKEFETAEPEEIASLRQVCVHIQMSILVLNAHN